MPANFSLLAYIPKIWWINSLLIQKAVGTQNSKYFLFCICNIIVEFSWVLGFCITWSVWRKALTFKTLHSLMLCGVCMTSVELLLSTYSDCESMLLNGNISDVKSSALFTQLNSWPSFHYCCATSLFLEDKSPQCNRNYYVSQSCIQVWKISWKGVPWEAYFFISFRQKPANKIMFNM